jgi:hypothetical protein
MAGVPLSVKGHLPAKEQVEGCDKPPAKTTYAGKALDYCGIDWRGSSMVS